MALVFFFFFILPSKIPCVGVSFKAWLKRATRFDGEELAKEGCSLGNITETFMVMEATLIIPRNLSNSDGRRKRETLKNVYWMCDRRFLKTFLKQKRWTCRLQRTLGRTTILIHQVFWELSRARHCLRLPATRPCANQVPALGGSSVLEGGGVKCFVAMTSEQKLEWDGGQAKCYLEIKYKRKTICVKREINKKGTQRTPKGWTGTFSLLSITVFYQKGSLSRNEAIYTFGFFSIKPRRML